MSYSPNLRDPKWLAVRARVLARDRHRCTVDPIYFTPFAAWGVEDNAPVEGSGYAYKDIFLYANGQKQVLAASGAAGYLQ